MCDLPIISIIIPCYNDADFIEQAVDSALNQTYQNKEVIVVDDGSDTRTKFVLESLEPRIKELITQENKGQSAARNRGIQAASGKYILLLDSDDYFEPTFCEKALDSISDEALRLVTCQALLHFDSQPNRIFIPKGGSLKDFLFSNSALGNCAMFNKVDWQKAGGYDECMRNGWEDWEFYIRLLKLGGYCSVIPEPLFNYRKRSNSTTALANKKKYELWSYIFKKHSDLYKSHYEAMIDFLLEKIEHEEKEKIKNTKRLDFRIGKVILKPIRFFKNKFK